LRQPVFGVDQRSGPGESLHGQIGGLDRQGEAQRLVPGGIRRREERCAGAAVGDGCQLEVAQPVVAQVTDPLDHRRRPPRQGQIDAARHIAEIDGTEQQVRRRDHLHEGIDVSRVVTGLHRAKPHVVDPVAASQLGHAAGISRGHARPGRGQDAREGLRRHAPRLHGEARLLKCRGGIVQEVGGLGQAQLRLRQ